MGADLNEKAMPLAIRVQVKRAMNLCDQKSKDSPSRKKKRRVRACVSLTHTNAFNSVTI